MKASYKSPNPIYPKLKLEPHHDDTNSHRNKEFKKTLLDSKSSETRNSDTGHYLPKTNVLHRGYLSPSN